MVVTPQYPKTTALRQPVVAGDGVWLCRRRYLGSTTSHRTLSPHGQGRRNGIRLEYVVGPLGIIYRLRVARSTRAVGKRATMAGAGEIEIPDYARLRMDQRKISDNQVRRVLTDPHRVWQSHDGRWVAERDTAMGAVLRVVYLERPEGPLVVTVLRIGQTRLRP